MKRFVLKLSGEALAGKEKKGIDDVFLSDLAGVLKTIKAEIIIVVGAGNFWRGRQTDSMNKAAADHMGMLATVMNSVAISEALTRNGVANRHFCTFEVAGIAERYSVYKADDALTRGEVVIVSGGTGAPFFTTDSGASLRACELHADELLLAKNIDGVYDKDPVVYSDAKRFDKLSISEAIDRRLKVMDLTAMAMCMENHINIKVFALKNPDNIVDAVNGTDVGTFVES